MIIVFSACVIGGKSVRLSNVSFCHPSVTSTRARARPDGASHACSRIGLSSSKDISFVQAKPTATKQHSCGGLWVAGSSSQSSQSRLLRPFLFLRARAERPFSLSFCPLCAAPAPVFSREIGELRHLRERKQPSPALAPRKKGAFPAKKVSGSAPPSSGARLPAPPPQRA